jgi:hypothetical protein
MGDQELPPRVLPPQPPMAFSLLRREQGQAALDLGRLLDPVRVCEPDVGLGPGETRHVSAS